MPKSRGPGRSKPRPDEQDGVGPPPGQAEVARAIGRILDRLKPKTPRRDRKTTRIDGR